MHVNKHIDYLQYSAEKQAFNRSEKPEIIRSPVPFYTKAVRYEDGTLVCTGNPNTDNALVIMSGKVCEFYREHMETITRVMLNNGGKVSRIDFAVDVDRSDVRGLFADAIRRNMYVSRRYQNDAPKIITNKEFAIETYYLGDMKKRAKKGQFRMYDKAIELGLEDVELTRFELECRRGVAHSNAKRWINGVDIGNIIRKSVDLPKSEWWIDMLGCNDPLPQLPDEKKSDSDVWSWLMKQVAPALGKALAQDRISGAQKEDEFWKIVQREHDRYFKKD